jgi:RNA polymerase sigma-70 factor (ECF subfamily)
MLLIKDVLARHFEKNTLIFRRYLKRKFNALNDYDVEDVIQQTFINIMGRGNDFIDIKNITAYTYSALQNTAKDYFKKQSRVELWETLPDEEQGTSLEYDIMNQEMNEMLISAINSLEENLKFVFVETMVKGRSYNELVEETGEKLGTLLSRNSRAKKKLKEALQEYMGGTDHD